MKKTILPIIIILISLNALSARNHGNYITLQYEFKEGLAAVRLNYKWGFINSGGKFVIPAKFIHAESFQDGIALVEINKRLPVFEQYWGYINKRGEYIIKPKYLEAYSFRNGRACVLLKKTQTLSMDWHRKYYQGSFGFINTAGRIVFRIPGSHAADWTFSDGLVVYHRARFNPNLIRFYRSNYGFWNRFGKTVIRPVYQWAGTMNEGIASVRQNGKFGAINRNARLLIPVRYDRIGYYSGGLMNAQLNGKWGYLNNTGKTIIPFRFENATPFSSGFAAVKLLGKWGLINKQGELVIPAVHDFLRAPSKEGLLRVRKRNKWAYLDTSGKSITGFIYDYASYFNEGMASVKLGNKWGFINTRGELIIRPRFDDIH